MANNLTTKQNVFVSAYIENGGNATAAAAKAGFSPSSTNRAGYRLLKNPKVAAAIAADREKLRQASGWNAERFIQKAEEAAQFAKDKNNSMAFVKAVELIGKATGLLRETLQLDAGPNLMEAIAAAKARTFPAHVVDADYSLISAAPTLDKPVDIFEE